MSLSESKEFCSPPNDRERSEKVPELDALESLRGSKVNGDDNAFEWTTDGGTSVDAEATMMLLLLDVETA